MLGLRWQPLDGASLHAVESVYTQAFRDSSNFLTRPLPAPQGDALYAMALALHSTTPRRCPGSTSLAPSLRPTCRL